MSPFLQECSEEERQGIKTVPKMNQKLLEDAGKNYEESSTGPSSIRKEVGKDRRRVIESTKR